MKRVRRNGQGRKLQTAAAFALGATAGSLATLVCAPQSGRIVRKRLFQRARGLQRTAVRQLGKTKRLIGRQADQVRDAAIGTIDSARDWVTERLNNTQHKLSNRPRVFRHRVLHHRAVRSA